MKNEDLQVDRAGDYLRGKSVALCVSGGIAAIETPKIARHLRRYGAEVKAFMTSAAELFIGKAALEWATERPVVKELSGMSEHICQEDLVLVAPATTNTVNKIFTGIADNSVTTLVASALGMGKPVHLAPTMHESLYKNPFFQENIAKAEQYNLKIIRPRRGEGKAKIPKLENLVAEVCRELSEDPIKGKKILITGGPTPGKVDDVRVLTNIFGGNLAVEMAKDAYHRGADVTLLLGKTGVRVPDYLDVRYHADFDEYVENVYDELGHGYDGGIFSAAVADYIPADYRPGKIKSQGGLKTIPLKETKKVIKEVRRDFPDLFMVTFKYEDGVSKQQLLGIADNRIKEGYQIVVANRKEEMGDSHCAYVVGKEGVISRPESKREIAMKVIDVVGEGLFSVIGK